MKIRWLFPLIILFFRHPLINCSRCITVCICSECDYFYLGFFPVYILFLHRGTGKKKKGSPCTFVNVIADRCAQSVILLCQRLVAVTTH